MKNLIFIVPILLLSLSCKKDELNRSFSNVTSDVSINDQKFKKIIDIPAGVNGKGVLQLSVFSDDLEYLENYCKKFMNSKLDLVQTEINDDSQPSDFNDIDTVGSVVLHFDWKNFEFETEKGKLYQLSFTLKDDSKSLILINSISNCSGFTSTSGFACVNVVNTTRRPWYCGCNRSIGTAKWVFKSGSNNFHNQYMNLNDNIEIRTIGSEFLLGAGFIHLSTQSNLLYYARPRFNYVSPSFPSDYVDVNKITNGNGYDGYLSDGVTSAAGTVTFYKAG